MGRGLKEMITTSRCQTRPRLIRDIVAADLASGKHQGCGDALSAGAERISASRACEVDRSEFRHRRRVCRPLPSAFRRHQSGCGEEQEFIDAIQRDVRWLGFDWGPHLHYASDYFEQLYAWARASDPPPATPSSTNQSQEAAIRPYAWHLDRAGAEQPVPRPLGRGEPRPVRAHARGRIPRRCARATRPHRHGVAKCQRARSRCSTASSMRVIRAPSGNSPPRMRGGDSRTVRVLRARIDMASPNVNVRDPVLYRILHARHPRTGTAWTIYPSYDFAHGQSDAIEHVTHSIAHTGIRGPPATLPMVSRPSPRALASAAPSGSRGSMSPIRCCPNAF